MTDIRDIEDVNKLLIDKFYFIGSIKLPFVFYLRASSCTCYPSFVSFSMIHQYSLSLRVKGTDKAVSTVTGLEWPRWVPGSYGSQIS
jgi:hypothetical protein